MVAECGRLRYILGPKSLAAWPNHAMGELSATPDRKPRAMRLEDRRE